MNTIPAFAHLWKGAREAFGLARPGQVKSRQCFAKACRHVLAAAFARGLPENRPAESGGAQATLKGGRRRDPQGGRGECRAHDAPAASRVGKKHAS